MQLFSLGLKLGQESGLAIGDLLLTLFVRELSQIPSLLGGCGFGRFLMRWFSTNGSMCLLVNLLDL